MQYFRKIIGFISIILIAGCHPLPARYSTSIEDTHCDLKRAIAINQKLNQKTPRLSKGASNALLPSITTPSMYEETEHRFDVVANKMPAKEFFMSLVDGTKYNMIVNPNVNGTITLKLKRVTIDETMEAVRDVYGYDYRHTSYGYEVLAPEIQTQIFTVNYLDVKRTGKSLTQMSSGQISEQITGFTAGSGGTTNQLNVTAPEQRSGSSVKTHSDIDFWHDLQLTLQTMIGTTDGRSVVVNPQAGVVIIHAFPVELRQVARYLDRIQSTMNRQVILEAKVLEVQLNNEFQAGINWNAFGRGVAPHVDPLTGEVVSDGGVSTTSFKTFRNTDLKDFENIFTLNVIGDFGTLIKLLQTQGNVQVLSSPRISTVNNQKAIIKVGQDEFFVTGVSTNNFVTANATVPTQDVSLTPFFSGVTLDVTPQISNNGEIVLHIHPSVSVVKEQQKNIVLGTVQSSTSSEPSPNTLSLPMALSTIRESDNIVRARNGQVVVIGGLMQNNTSEEVAGVPVLSKLPFIGTAFRRTRQVATKSELVILLRPVIADNKAIIKDMKKTDKDFAEYRRGFHVGGFPEVFGTEGETGY